MKKNKDLAVIIKFPTGDKHYVPVEKNETGYKAKIIPIERVIAMKEMGFDPGLMEIELSDIPIIKEASMKISIAITEEFLKFIKKLSKDLLKESKKEKKRISPFLKGELKGSFSIEKKNKENEDEQE